MEILYQTRTTDYQRRKDTRRIRERRELWESFCLECGRNLGHVSNTHCYPKCEPYMLHPDTTPAGGTGCIFRLTETEELK